jgi:hypothetical protein
MVCLEAAASRIHYSDIDISVFNQCKLSRQMRRYVREKVVELSVEKLTR